MPSAVGYGTCGPRGRGRGRAPRSDPGRSVPLQAPEAPDLEAELLAKRAGVLRADRAVLAVPLGVPAEAEPPAERPVRARRVARGQEHGARGEARRVLRDALRAGRRGGSKPLRPFGHGPRCVLLVVAEGDRGGQDVLVNASIGCVGHFAGVPVVGPREVDAVRGSASNA